ncbi:MAG: hypothetical protein AAF525_19020, partial [Pseudomonadota bacterium]
MTHRPIIHFLTLAWLTLAWMTLCGPLPVFGEETSTVPAPSIEDNCLVWIEEVTVALSKWESSKLRAHRQAKRRMPREKLTELEESYQAKILKSRLRDVDIRTGDTKAGYHGRFRAMGAF